MDFWPRNLSKLFQKGIFLPNFKKIGEHNYDFKVTDT